MKQLQPFVSLGTYDVRLLKEQMLAEQDSEWTRSVAERKRNWPHRDARHISLANDLDGRHFRATIFPKYAEYEALLAPLLNEIATRLARGRNVARIQFAWLGAGSTIEPHRDTSVTLLYSHRVHVPLATNDQVTFECGEESIVMHEGEIWTFDNTLRHAVYNRGETPRIHMIVDFTEPLPVTAWLPYLKHRLYRLRIGDTHAHRELARKAGAQSGTIEF
jgi:aspartyl/asparaginyl beta-hydroxylase (cupin superfamily)